MLYLALAKDISFCMLNLRSLGQRKERGAISDWLTFDVMLAWNQGNRGKRRVPGSDYNPSWLLPPR